MCPVDLTRTMPPTTPNTDKNSCRKLAFSVENILDPNKFCSRKENQINSRHWLNNGFEQDDRHHMDDDQSESQSGKSVNKTILYFVCVYHGAEERSNFLIKFIL